MADDILKPAKSGNSRAAQTRIKGKSAGGIGGQRAHDLRIGPQPDYVDASRAHLNRMLIAPQTGTQLRKLCEDRRALRLTTRAMKSSAAVGVVGIITFGHEAQKIFDALTLEQQDAAYRETAEAIAERLNTTLTGLVAHGDESAPHAHFQLPAYDLTGHPVSETAKRAALRDLQTITAEVMGRHAPGIERGRSKVDRLKGGATPAEVVNRSVAQLHDDLPIEIAQLETEIATKKNQSSDLDGEIAARQNRLSELAAKIEKNERLAAAALEKAATNEGKADKALKNAALYEGRAEKAGRERDAEERALSNLQLDRRKEEERLKQIRDEKASLSEAQRRAKQEIRDLKLEIAVARQERYRATETAQEALRCTEALTATQEALRAAQRLLEPFRTAYESLRSWEAHRAANMSRIERARAHNKKLLAERGKMTDAELARERAENDQLWAEAGLIVEFERTLEDGSGIVAKLVSSGREITVKIMDYGLIADHFINKTLHPIGDRRFRAAQKRIEDIAEFVRKLTAGTFLHVLNAARVGDQADFDKSTLLVSEEEPEPELEIVYAANLRICQAPRPDPRKAPPPEAKPILELDAATRAAVVRAFEAEEEAPTIHIESGPSGP